MKTSLLLVAVLCTATTYAGVAENLNQDPCPSRTTCHECIQAPSCIWCSDPNFGDKTRCYQPTGSAYCSEEFAWDPYNHFSIIRRKTYSVTDDGNIINGSISQSPITPELVQLKLRTNEPYKFKMHYTQAKEQSSVELKDTAKEGVRVNYYSNCLNKNSEPIQTNKCENIKARDEIAFFVEFEVTACPADPKDWNQTIQIYSDSIDESLTVNLEKLCSCSFKEPRDDNNYIENAECGIHGTYKYGSCECNQGFSGKNCEIVKEE